MTHEGTGHSRDSGSTWCADDLTPFEEAMGEIENGTANCSPPTSSHAIRTYAIETNETRSQKVHKISSSK